MKKIIIVLTVCMFGFSAMAQDIEDEEQTVEMENSENEFLPGAGDFALGIDGTPVFDFLSIIFHDGYSPDMSTNTLYFRYFLDRSSAVRATVGIVSRNDVTSYYVDDDAAQMEDPLSRDQVTDKRTEKTNSYAVSLGYQKFINNDKLRGFFGGDLGFSTSKETTTYEYGNEMNQINSEPTTVIDWENGFSNNDGERALKRFGGSVNTISVGAFTGAEYYFIPKMCVGTEVGLRYKMNFRGQGYREQERMVGTQYVEEEIEVSPSSTDWNVQTLFPYTYFQGTVYFIVHF